MKVVVDIRINGEPVFARESEYFVSNGSKQKLLCPLQILPPFFLDHNSSRPILLQIWQPKQSQSIKTPQGLSHFSETFGGLNIPAARRMCLAGHFLSLFPQRARNVPIGKSGSHFYPKRGRKTALGPLGENQLQKGDLGIDFVLEAA